VPFFFRQWGEWCPFNQVPFDQLNNDDEIEEYPVEVMEPHSVHRIGKKRAGRLLDGKEWSQFPV
jgi:hypothetical protein